MTRNRRRVLLLTGIFGLSLLSCGREVTGPGDGLPFGRSRVAALALDPQFPRLPGTNLASDLVPFVKVRVTLRGLDGAVVRDTVVDFPSTADSVALALYVPLPLSVSDSGLPLTLAMNFVNAAGDTVFRGGPSTITALAVGTPGAGQPIVIPVNWVPPGAVPASVVMTPTSGTAVAGTTTVFTATAFDGGGAPIPGTPIDFSADLASRASFAAPGSGTVTWLPSRGNVRIIASTLNLRADTSFFVVSLPAARLLAVSGGAQSAVIGTALAQPVVLRVTASDSVPVAGVPVTFAVTTGGGTLSAIADTSDLNGLVSTGWTLGSVVGAQSVTVSATGIAGATQVVTATGLAPLPTQLAITASPLSGVAGATLAPVVVDVRDANNVRTPLFSGPVTLALNAGATGATLVGTATVNAVAGVATFGNLSIQRAAGGLSFTASSGALTPGTSAAFTIAPATPAALVALAGNAQSGTLGQPLTDSIDVRLTDAFANPIAGATIAFSIVSGGGGIAPATAVTDANGRARARWTLGALVGAQSARAQLDGVPTIVAALAATGAPGAPVRLEIITETSATQTAGAPFAPAIVVRAVDAVGATTTAFTGTVNLVLAANPASATPSGTLSTTAVAGIATFTNVMLTTSGVGYTFAATSGALVPDTTIAITVLSAAATQLTLVSGNTQSGVVITALAAPFVVRVSDAFNNPVAGVTVTWAILSGGGALSATSTATTAAGLGSTSLTLPSASGTVTVAATATGLTGSPIAFVASALPGTASQLVVTQQPGPYTAALVGPTIVAEARDGAGNLVSSYTGSVTLTILAGPPGAVLGIARVRAAVGGVVTFDDLTLNLAGTYTIQLSATGLANVNTDPLTVVAAAPAQIALLSGNAQTAAVLAALTDSIAFRVTDASGNAVPGAPVTVAITVGGGNVSPVSGVTDAIGRFATAWTLGPLLGAQSLTATITTAPTAQAVSTATATPGAAVALALINTLGSVVAGDTIPDVVVQARDANGNVATAFNGVVNGRVLTGPDGPGTDSVSATAVNGVATFSGLTFDRAGDYTLRFYSVGVTDVIHPTFRVSPGAVTSIVAVAGTAQTGAVSTTLPDSIGARVTDAFGNPVEGVTVTWSLQAGGGSLALSLSNTDTLGIARNAWTLGATVGTQSVSATAAGLTPVTFTATATGSLTNLTWTGTTSANWSVASNWSGGVVPTASDSVRIPAATPFAAQVDQQALVVGRLLVESGATVVLDTFPLFVAGTLDVAAGAAVLSDSLGGFALIGNGAVRGAMPRLYVQSGAYALNGPLALSDGVAISGGSLDIGAFAATVGGDLTSLGTGQLVMTTASGSVTVQGDAFFAGGSTAGSLTAGVLAVRGDFIQGGGAASAFSASGTHVVELDGTVTQTVTLLNPDLSLASTCATGSCFATLRSLKSAGEGAVVFGSSAKAIATMQFSGDSVYAPGMTLLSAGSPAFQSAVTVADAIGWQVALTRGASFQVDTLIAWGTSADLMAGETIPTRVLGGYRLFAAHPGAIVVDGAAGALDVDGAVSVGSGTGTALVTRGNGRVRMSQATDSLAVLGDVDFGGVTVPGEMTNGVLEVGGAFVMSNASDDAFIAGGAHVTRFIGPDATVEFVRIGGNQFANLAVNSASGFAFTGSATIGGDVVIGPTTAVVSGGLITIGGDLIDSVGTRWQVTETFFQGADPVIPPQFTGSAVFLNGVVLDTATTIGGNLEIRGGLFDVNGRRVDVAGQFEARTAGALRMANAADTLVVDGTATFRGASTAGQLSAGYLELRGAFAQSGNAEAFAASGTHRTTFVSGVVDTANISFADPATATFARLEVQRPVRVQSRARVAADLLLYYGGAIAGPGRLEIAGDFVGTSSTDVTINALEIGGVFADTGSYQADTTVFTGTGQVLPFAVGSASPNYQTVRITGTVSATTGGGAGFVDGDLLVDGGTLSLSAATYTSIGTLRDLRVTNGGRLRSLNESHRIVVARDALFDGGPADGDLASGELYVTRHFTQLATTAANSFRPAPAYTVYLDSSGTVSFADPVQSRFGRLQMFNNGVSRTLLSDISVADAIYLNSENGVIASSLLGAGGTRTITTDIAYSYADLGVTMRNVALRARLLFQFNTSILTFDDFDPAVVQVDLRADSGVSEMGIVRFLTTPTGAGRYLRVEDTNAADGLNYRVNLTGAPTPSFHGGFAEVIAPAVLNSWAASPGFTWTGATNSNWLTATNWSNGVVPTGADSVRIPTGLARYPVVGSDTAVRVLTMDAGATLDHGGSIFKVRGSVALAPTATVTASSGRFELTGPGAQTVRGSFRRLRVDGGEYALSGAVVTGDDVQIYNGDLSIGSSDLTIGTGLFVGEGGTLTMTGTGTVDVATYVNFFGNSTAGRLTNGILRVRGDFDQLSGGSLPTEDLSFSASGAHVVELAGTGRQRVRFDSPDTTITGSCATSCFATLRSVQAPGTGWVEFSNGVKILGDLDLQADSVVALGARLVVAGTARFNAPILRAGLIAWQDSVSQSASTALAVDSLVAWGTDTLLVGMPGVRSVVTGSYRLRGTLPSGVDVQGALAIEGASRVIGNFRTSGSGTITMRQVGDTLAVDSTATFGGGSTAGLLTGGTVRVGGDFFTTSSAAYAASGAHRTVLYNGCGLCDGYFVGLSDTLSTFRDLEIESGSWTVNPPSAEVHISDNLSLLGSAQFDGIPLVRVGNNVTGALATGLSSGRLSVAGAFDFAGTYFVDTLILAGANQTLTARDPLGNVRNYINVRVTGTATVIDDAANEAQVNGRLVVDGGTLRVGTILTTTDSARVRVTGVFETRNGGLLEMRAPLGRLATGFANFAGGSTAGLITAGTLAISGGDFTQAGNPEAFVASGTHETRFSNEGVQRVTFANPGSGAAASRFQHLRIQQAASSGLELLSDVVAAGQLRESMSAPALLRAPLATPRTLTTGGASVGGIEFDYVRWVLRDGAPVDSTVAIRFDSMPANVTQFDIIRGGGTVLLQTLDFVTPPSTGLYLRAEDGNVANGIPLVVAVSNPTPASHGGAIAFVAGATITGWAQDPPLQGIVWTGAVSTSWSIPGNWNLARVPIATDSVFIGGSVLTGAGNPYTVDINVNTTVAKLIIGPTGSLTLNHTFGQALTINTLSSMPSNVAFNITNGSVLAGAGDVNFGGFLNWNGGTIAGTGTMTVQAGGTAAIASANAVALNGRVLSIAGTATLGTGTISGVNAPSIAVLAGGTLEFGATRSYVVSTGSVALINNGTLRKAASAARVIVEWPISNTGLIQVVDDTLDVQGLLTNAGGTVSILGGATLLARGETNSTGAVTVGSGGLMQLQSGGIGTTPGQHVFGPGSSVTGLGTVSFNSANLVLIQGAFDIDSLTILNGQTSFESATDTMFVNKGAYIGGGQVRGTGVLGIRGNFRTLSGNLTGSGTIAVLPGATYTPQADVLGWRIDVRGTMIWGDYFFSLGQDPVSLQFAAINVRTGGLVNIQHGATDRDIFGGAAAVTTAVGGTIRKSSGTGISTFRQSVIHSGVFDVLTGTLNMQTGSCAVIGGTKTGPGALVGGCVVP